MASSAGRLPPLSGVPRRQYRRFWRYARARTARRLREAHCLPWPRYPRFGKDIGRPSIWKAGSIVWAIKRLFSGLPCSFRIFSDHKALENIGKVWDHDARVQRWLESLTAFDCTLEDRKGSAKGVADFLSRLPQPAPEHDLRGFSCLTPVDDEAIHLVSACGLLTLSTPVPGVGLGGLVPQPDSAVSGGLPLSSTGFRDFRAHGPRMRIDDLSAPTG